MERNEDLDLNLNQRSNEDTDQQEFVEIDLEKFFTDHVFRDLLEERYGKFNLGKNYV